MNTFLFILFAALAFPGLVSYVAARGWRSVLLGYICILLIAFVSTLIFAQYGEGGALGVVVIIFPSTVAAFFGWSLGAYFGYQVRDH